jgi:hypothetical protein
LALIKLILEFHQIKIVCIEQDDSKTLEALMLEELQAIIFCYTAKLHGKRAGARTRKVLSPDTVKYALSLIQAGQSVEDVRETLVREGHTCESGETITYMTVRKCIYLNRTQLAKVYGEKESSADRYKKECLEEIKGVATPVAKMYPHYVAWAKKRKLLVVSDRKFFSHFNAATRLMVNNKQVWCYQGLAIKGKSYHLEMPANKVANKTHSEIIGEFTKTLGKLTLPLGELYSLYEKFCHEEGYATCHRKTLKTLLGDWGYSPLKEGRAVLFVRTS